MDLFDLSNYKVNVMDQNKCIPDINSASEETLAEVPSASANDVSMTIEKAQKAFSKWATLSPSIRSSFLLKCAEQIESCKDIFSEIISREIGMPIKHCLDCHVTASIDEAYYYAELARQYDFSTPFNRGLYIREPFGVAALLTPWNYPLYQIIVKVFPALAAGNTVILKPSKSSPVTALFLEKIMRESGLPDGVFNIILGNGRQLSDLIISDPGIDLVSFTGSTNAGKEIGSKAMLNGAKKVVLEMGGKSAMILLNEKYEDLAINDILEYTMLNSGQTCNAYTRFIIPENRKHVIENKLSEKLKEYIVGDPTDARTDIGPVISEAACSRIKKYIQAGVESGAKIVAEVPIDDSLSPKRYVPPTVLSDVNCKMKVAQEEIFGPVLVLLSYSTVEEAISIANDTTYGLDGAVYGDPTEAIGIAKKIRSGNIHVNNVETVAGVPFGGYKESGYGRECGILGMEEYLEFKSIII